MSGSGSTVGDYPEGATPLDPEELEGLRYKHVTTRGELDELEQANIDEGMQWLKKQKKPDVLTEDFVCALHKKLFGKVWKWAGTFKRTEKISALIRYRSRFSSASCWTTPIAGLKTVRTRQKN